MTQPYSPVKKSLSVDERRQRLRQQLWRLDGQPHEADPDTGNPAANQQAVDHELQGIKRELDGIDCLFPR